MRKKKEINLLSPAQQKAFEAVIAGIANGNLVLLKARTGAGRTTILRKVQAAAGGILLSLRQFIDVRAASSTLTIEESFLRRIEEALGTYELVLVDDLHLLTQVTRSCDYPRAFLLEAALTAILGDWLTLDKKLVFATDGDAPWPIVRRAMVCEIAESRQEANHGSKN